MDEVTYVTAFFKLREKENNKNTDGFCSVERYLDSSKQLLEKDMNLIIFIEPDLKEHVMKYRKNLIHKTLIITKNFEELRLWSRLNDFIRADQRYHISNLDTKKFTPLYHLIINSKVDFVEEAITLNPFNTPRFAWIDFRAFDLSPVTDEFFRRMPEIIEDNRIRINMMALCVKEEIINRSEYYKIMRGKIAGTFWIGGRNELLQFIKKCQKELEWCLNNGWSVTEEMIFGVIFAENRELFNPYCGDYTDSLSNFDVSRKNLWLSAASFKYALNYNSIENIIHLGKYLIDSHNHPEGAKLDLYHQYEVYYNLLLTYNKLNKKQEVLKLLKEWLNINNEDLKNRIRARKDFLLGMIHSEQSGEITQLLERV
jgi:tetratricopeptide (TPR) repeat protein